MTRQRYTIAIVCAVLGVMVSAAPLAAQPAPTRAEREDKAIAVLKSDAAIYDKAKACQELALVGSGRSVDVLAGLLGDKQLGDYARTALEPIDSPNVDAALRNALGALKGRQLAGVVNSTGVRRDVKAVGQLQKIARDRSSGAAPQALWALARIGTSDALKIVSDVLTSGPAELREAAADAALVGAERLLAQKKTAPAIALYTVISKADVEEHLKAAASYHAIVAQGPAGVPQLVAHLRSDSTEMRRVALNAARAMPDAKVTAALAAALPKAPPTVQITLIELLAERGGPESLKAVWTIGSDFLPVQMAVIEALGKIGDGTVVRGLVRAAECSPNEDVVKAAVMSLRTIPGQGADEAILTYVAKGVNVGRHRTDLIGVLVARQYAPTVGTLLTLDLLNFNQDDRIAGFKAFGALAGPKDLPAIISTLARERDATVRPHAEQAIASVARRIPDPAARADAVLAALAKTDKKPLRCSLIRALGGIGGARAYAAVAKVAGDDDADVKDAAIRALTAWPDGHAGPALLEIVKTTKNTTYRVLALRGYVRLLGLDATASPKQAVRKYAEAMALAKRADEKKLVLSGLAGVAHVDALAVVGPHLDDKAVVDEAALAAVSIARATMGASRAEVRAAMAKVASAAKGTASAGEARKIIAQIDKFADAITAWRVTGPYMQEGVTYDKLFDVPFAPETAAAKGVTWRVLPAGTDAKRPWILDLKKAIGGDQRAAYVLTWVHSATAQPARLEMGSDDGIKAWLNGEFVHGKNAPRAAIPYTDKVNVTLKAGWNSLMFKITQNNVPWEFCARLAHRRKGKTLEGIRIDASHEGDWKLPANAASKAAAASDSDKAPAGPTPAKLPAAMPDFSKVPAVALFDGKTFAGWEGNLKSFRIEDGAVVGGTLKAKIPRNEFLCTKKNYADFELRLKVKLAGGKGNAGIQFRTRRIPNHHEVSGYQADMGMQYWGCLYDESRRRKVLASPDKAALAKVLKRDGWNEYVIRCAGPRIQLFINGLKTVDTIERDAKIDATGIIGLQIHGGAASEAWYKDITIRELSK